jgi:hypothetical protein
LADSATITRIGGLLKNTYGPAIVEQQNKIAAFRRRYGKADSAARMGGDHFEFPVRVAGGRGAVAPSASDSALPVAVRQSEKKFLVYDRTYFGLIKVYDKDIENSKTNAQAFANHLTNEMTNMVQDFEKVINIDLVAGDGSGILGIIQAGATSTGQKLICSTGFGQWGARYLAVGDVIDIYDSTLVTSRTSGAGLTVSAITPATTVGASSFATVTVASVTTTTGDIVVRGIAGPNQSYVGLGSIDATSTSFQGLSKVTYPILKSTVISPSASLLESHLAQLDSLIETASGEGVDEFYVSQAQWDAYEALGFAQKRFMETKMDKGFTSTSFRGKAFVKDVDVPPSVVYGLAKEVIQFGELTPLGFMDKDGDVLKWDPGYAAYKAVPREYGNMVYLRPNRLGKIDSLSFANAYAK